MDISARSYLTAGLALTTAGAIALTPLMNPTAPRDIAAAPLPKPHVELTALITPADITALIDGLNSASDSVSSTVTDIAAVPGQTLVSALKTAAALNNTWWDQLINATNNPTLINVLTTLRDLSHGGLSELAATADSTSDTVTLTTGQVASLLVSTLTGSVATAQHAVATAINNPLATSSLTGLLNVPLNIAGLGSTPDSPQHKTSASTAWAWATRWSTRSPRRSPTSSPQSGIWHPGA